MEITCTPWELAVVLKSGVTQKHYAYEKGNMHDFFPCCGVLYNCKKLHELLDFKMNVF